jgi:hypothetical protein
MRAEGWRGENARRLMGWRRESGGGWVERGGRSRSEAVDAVKAVVAYFGETSGQITFEAVASSDESPSQPGEGTRDIPECQGVRT